MTSINKKEVAQLTKQISEEAKKWSTARTADGKVPVKGAAKGNGGKFDEVAAGVISSLVL